MLILVILLLTGVPVRRLLFGVTFGMGVGMAASIVAGGFISVPAGIVAGVLGGLLSGVARGIAGEGAIGTALGGLTSVMAGGIASVGITVVAAVASRQVTYPFRRRIGSVLMGLVIAAMVMSLVILIARSTAIRSLVGIPAGGVVGLAAGGVVWLRTWQGRRGLVVGLVTASLAGVACSGAVPGQPVSLLIGQAAWPPACCSALRSCCPIRWPNGWRVLGQEPSRVHSVGASAWR